MFPNKLVIEEAKILDYLLHPTNSNGKSAIFQQWGYSRSMWVLLKSDLLEHPSHAALSETKESTWGTKFVFDGAMFVPSGDEPLVRTVWQNDAGTDFARLITAYPGA